MIWPKILRTAGVLLIALGIGFCGGLILYQYLHCADFWQNSYKSSQYASALEYFFAVSKGAIIISLFGGAIPVIAGIHLLARSR